MAVLGHEMDLKFGESHTRVRYELMKGYREFKCAILDGWCRLSDASSYQALVYAIVHSLLTLSCKVNLFHPRFGLICCM